jgi:four helix bundle protein
VTPRELSARIELWAVSVLRLTRPLLSRLESRDLAQQLRRSATATSVNYGSATVARSHADFTSKIGIALEEAEESLRWLRLCRDGLDVRGPELDRILEEARQLVAILGASAATAKRKRGPSAP